MNAKSLPLFSFLLPLFPVLQFLILIPQLPCGPTFPTGDEIYYQTCGNVFSCGNISGIGYPFRSYYDEPPYCGHPGFELLCNEGNITTIDIKNVSYRVLEINQASKTMKIVREDIVEENCPQEFNSTLDNALFQYTSGYVNLTFLYGCRGAVNSIPGIGTIPCGDSNAYVFMGTGGSVNCNSSVVVPVPDGGSVVDSTVLVKALKEGLEIRWKTDSKACDDCTKSKGKCGINMFNETTCYCPSPPYISATCSVSLAFPESRKGPSTGVKVALVAIFGLLGVVLTSALIIYFLKWRCFWRRGDERLENIEAFVRTKGFHATKLYTYSNIKKMTNSFNNKIGQGGFGSVYRGKLPDGCPVAVKLLTNTKGNGEDFINEVASISQTSHVNIVTLVGFSYQKKRALVYEFMPNGSLDKYIGNNGSQNITPSCQLEWKTLYQIAIGIARGLEYLHRGCNTRIMHFDIKPNNILLDKDFTPKISDFGLAKLCKKKESIVSLSVYGARGTIGYIAPEVFYRSIGNVSHKSDVYSYGMTVIDMVGVRENVNADQTSDLYFPNWIYEHLEQGLDFSLEGIRDEEDKEMAMKMMLVSLWCIQTNPVDRPSIRRVVEMLEESIDSLQIPPKPFFCPPTNESPQQSFTSSATTEI